MADMNASAVKRSSEELLEELARREEIEVEGGGRGNETDSTLKLLKAELDTLASQIRGPAPVVPFEDESDCRRVTELVEALGLSPSLAGGDSDAAGAIPSLGEIGQYKLLAKLGQGGMGAVYKALHTKLNKIVALKVLPEQKTNDPHAVARFEREMRAVGKLDTPTSCGRWTRASMRARITW